MELVFKIKINSGQTYSSHVFQDLDIIPAEVAFGNLDWVFDKSSKVTYFPNSLSGGKRGHYEVQYLTHVRDYSEVRMIQDEIDKIQHSW